ncbi:MAG: SGNH/GDSL hydrolase family protein [Nitrospinae bacterium]|nr:SGNH/GDSL hydrolase family protein [Nitrospinota bacterium]
MSFIKNLLFTVATILIFALLYLGAIEMFLRMNERKMAHHLYNWRSFHVADGNTGWSMEPYAAGYVETWNGLIHTSINSMGARDREYAAQKGPDTRVLFLGDSFLYDNAYNFEEMYKSVTEFRLRRAGYEAEIVNAGTNGYGTDQELLFYQSKGKALKPDITVLHIYVGNDIRDNAAGLFAEMMRAPTEKPYFTLNEGKTDIILKNHPYKGPLAKSFVDPYNDPMRINGYEPFRFMCLRSLLLHEVKLNLLWEYRLAPLFGLAHKEDEGKSDAFDKAYGPLWTKTPSDKWKEAFLLTHLIIKKLKAEVEKDGGKFGVVIIPKREALEPQAAGPNQPYYLSVEDDLEPFLRNEKIPYMRLYHPFSQVNGKYAVLYEGGVHWNGAGHAVAAHAVSNWLAETFPIKKGAATDWKFD